MGRVGALELLTPGRGNRRQSVGVSKTPGTKTPGGKTASMAAAGAGAVSAESLEREFLAIATQLEDPDWECRVDALERLAAAADAQVGLGRIVVLHYHVIPDSLKYSIALLLMRRQCDRT